MISFDKLTKAFVKHVEAVKYYEDISVASPCALDSQDYPGGDVLQRAYLHTGDNYLMILENEGSCKQSRMTAPPYKPTGHKGSRPQGDARARSHPHDQT